MMINEELEEQYEKLFKHNARDHVGEPLCSICSGRIDIVGPPEAGWRGGHNAEPINSGRCCSECNDKFVIAARIVRMQSKT